MSDGSTGFIDLTEQASIRQVLTAAFSIRQGLSKTEAQPRHPFGLPVTAHHSGRTVGPGWASLNTLGDLNVAVFSRLASRQELALPMFELDTVHWVHAEDVAQAFAFATDLWAATVGENLHIVSTGAVTLREYAEATSAWFDHPADLTCLPWPAWQELASRENAATTLDHISRSSSCSGVKAAHLLEGAPCYASLDAAQKSLGWFVNDGQARAAC